MQEKKLMPKSVKQGTNIMWTIIVLSILGLLLHKFIGFLYNDEFIISMSYYIIVCVIIYKIGTGNNIARYLYLILFIFSTVKFLTSSMAVTGISLLISALIIPLNLFAIYKVFNKESKEWFSKK